MVLLAFGTLTFHEAPRLQANLPTPWIGLSERLNISAFLLRIGTLAVMLWRIERQQGDPGLPPRNVTGPQWRCAFCVGGPV